MIKKPGALRLKKIVIGSFFLALLILMLVPSQTNAYYSRRTAATTTTSTIDVVVLDSYYTDLDNDGNQDDVVSTVAFILNNNAIYQFDYLITLILPSGLQYQYYVTVVSFVDIVILDNLFYNHATEAGYYTIIVETLLYYPSYDYAVDGHVFDPPGGSDGGKPTFAVA